MDAYGPGDFAFNKIVSYVEEEGGTKYLVDFVHYEPEFVTVEAFEDCLSQLHRYHRLARMEDALADPVSAPTFA